MLTLAPVSISEANFCFKYLRLCLFKVSIIIDNVKPSFKTVNNYYIYHRI